VGNSPLKDRFARLFSISTQKDAMVADLFRPNSDDHWAFQWRRRFFVWEEELLGHLRDLINPISLTEADDCWGWTPENGDAFSVRSTFVLVSGLSQPNLNLSPCHLSVFDVIWKCPSPSKVCAFAWQLLHDRIPSRQNLQRRNIIEAAGDVSCVLCGGEAESSHHLFIYCTVAMKVWQGVFGWLKLSFLLPHNLFSILNFFTYLKGKKLRKGMIMIWLGVIWILWRRRNAVLFDNGGIDVAEIIEEIKVITWKWWLSQPKVKHSLYYEWQLEPLLCMAG
jgi:hypothetical protein